VQKRFKLDGATCKIEKNGDITLAPASRHVIYVLLAGIVAVAWLVDAWLRSDLPQILIAVLLIVVAVVVLLRWLYQPKLRILPASAAIEWRKGFRTRRLVFADVDYVEVSLDLRQYAWSAHLVSRRKNEVEWRARLALILKDGSHLPLGRISGEHAPPRSSRLAEILARAIGVPVTSASA